jgi:hypothetical protein
LADHRVLRLLSTALPGTFPSLVLAVAPAAPGVTSTYVWLIAAAADSARTPAITGTNTERFRMLEPPLLYGYG